MAQTYDVTLKTLFRNSCGYGSLIVFGGPVVEWLDVQQPKVSNRLGDLLAKTSDGRLHHVELQLRNDPEMPFRMLEYFVGYYRRHGPVSEVLIYVGSEPLRMSDVFEREGTRHTFRIIDIRELDPKDFLATGDWGDNALALLTRKDREAVIHAALHHLTKLKGDERTTAQATFVIISGIIGLEEEIARRLDIDMIDLMENKVIGPMIRQGLTAARNEAQKDAHASTLRKQLVKRFGALPAAMQEKIDSADDSTLEAWLLRVIDAPTLPAVFEWVADRPAPQRARARSRAELHSAPSSAVFPAAARLVLRK